jgi:eukaryotic-like serine/threonine-protein kinase
MITGRPAFVGGSTASTLAAILRDEPVRISEVVTTVPPELERIVTRCLRKDPARRFQHMDDVRVELQEIKEDHESGSRTHIATAGGVPNIACGRLTSPFG